MRKFLKTCLNNFPSYFRNKEIGRTPRGGVWGCARSHVANVLLCLALTSCNLWNGYETPVTPEPEKYAGAEKTGNWPDKEWWKKFNSDELTGLIEKAQGENYDIRAAVARVKEADAQAQIAGAPLWPLIGATAGATRTRGAIAQNNGNTVVASNGKHRYVTALNAGVNASYELDFWGKNWSAEQSSLSLAEASRFDAETVRLTTIADIANTYFAILAAQDRISLANENLSDSEKLLDAINRRFKAGLETSLDVAQQENLVATVKATIPPLELQLRQNIDALSILMGKLPESPDVPSGKAGMLAQISYPEILPGLPSELLQRRPDVQEAEAQLKAANFDITNARAQFFPSIGLTAQGGFQSSQLGELFKPGSLLLAAGANLAQPIFEGFSLVGQYSYSKARYNELLSDYRKSAISAFSDVEDALAAVQDDAAQEAAQVEAVKTAQAAYDASQKQFQGGIIDITTLLNTQRSLFSAQDTLIQVRLLHLEALVGLYRVLGGGWENNGNK